MAGKTGGALAKTKTTAKGGTRKTGSPKMKAGTKAAHTPPLKAKAGHASHDRHAATGKPGPLPPAGTKLTAATAIYSAIATRAGMARIEVSRCFDAMREIVGWELRKGRGESLIPGLLKIKLSKKPAVKARQGLNPFTKEPTTFKAKPARNVVKAVPLKALRDMAGR